MLENIKDLLRKLKEYDWQFFNEHNGEQALADIKRAEKGVTLLRKANHELSQVIKNGEQ